LLTLFTTAKPFQGHSAIIQRNALKSWTLLHPDVDVILFGDDFGAAEVAHELSIRHEPYVERNEHGTKRLDYMFGRAQSVARHDLFCYINCDIILTGDFLAALERVRGAHSRFLMVGRRWDIDISAPYDFLQPDWQKSLRAHALQRGKQRTPEWIDYFAFTRGIYDPSMPPFVIGRVHWDNWLLWKACDSQAAVVDASAEVVAIHQNHDYGYHPQGKSGVWHGEEAGRNYRLAGGWKHLRTIADATELLQSDGLRPNRWLAWARAKRHVRQAKRVLRFDVWHPVLFFALGVTRPLRSALGLRSESLRRSRE
jgi:hypothetical protein